MREGAADVGVTFDEVEIRLAGEAGEGAGRHGRQRPRPHGRCLLREEGAGHRGGGEPAEPAEQFAAIQGHATKEKG